MQQVVTHPPVIARLVCTGSECGRSAAGNWFCSVRALEPDTAVRSRSSAATARDRARIDGTLQRIGHLLSERPIQQLTVRPTRCHDEIGHVSDSRCRREFVVSRENSPSSHSDRMNSTHEAIHDPPSNSDRPTRSNRQVGNTVRVRFSRCSPIHGGTPAGELCGVRVPFDGLEMVRDQHRRPRHRPRSHLAPSHPAPPGFRRQGDVHVYHRSLGGSVIPAPTP